MKVDYQINANNMLSTYYNHVHTAGEHAIQTPIVLGNVGRNGSDDVRINAMPLNFDVNLPPALFTRVFQLPDGTTFEVPFTVLITRGCRLCEPHLAPVRQRQVLGGRALRFEAGLLGGVQDFHRVE